MDETIINGIIEASQEVVGQLQYAAGDVIKNINIVNGSKTGSLRTVGSAKEGSGYEIGDYAFAEGYNTKASGDRSHAEGFSTKASGDRSHAEGFSTTASGVNSHAEGNSTTALGGHSHAEGNSTNLFSSVVTATNPTNDDIITAWNNSKFSLAKGISSHIEGTNNLALGSNSHAEGNNTKASGAGSHAEGYNTEASGSTSHTEGNSTKASGGGSHAEGWNTEALGSNSHAEGGNTTASNSSTHAEGSNTTASGINSHAEGYFTNALGSNSHAEGEYTQALSQASHAEGNNTKALGNYSHAEGEYTKALGDHSHAEGAYTKAGQMGFRVTACEKLTDTTGTYTLTSVTGLYKNLRYSIHLSSSKENCGKITAIDTTNKKITVDGYPDITLSSSNSSNYITIVSRPELGDIKISGSYSHAEGSYTTALGDSSHTEGYGTTASSDYQHVQGKYNIPDSNNIYADIIGNGKSDTERSNASTVDWQGNVWYAGDVYVGSTSGTNRDDGSKKLATEEYTNIQIIEKTDQIYNPTSENAQSGKAVAQAILNADTSQKPFIKIADITLTEATSLVTITKDINGNDFSLVDVIASFIAPSETTERTIQVYFGVSETAIPNKAFVRIPHRIITMDKSESRCYAVVRHRRIINVSSMSQSLVNGYQGNSVQQILQGIGYLEADSIDRLHIFTYNDGGFSAGSRIVIEGVAR